MRFKLPRWVLLGGIILPTLFLGIVALLPTDTFLHGPTYCLFRNVFGIECFGCGMTRAISSALHAEFSEAIRYNPLVIVMLPIIVTCIFLCFGRFKREGRLN